MRKCLLNTHADVSSEARRLTFRLSLHLHLYFEHASSEGYDKSVHMRSFAWVFAGHWCDKYQNRVHFPI